MTNDLMNLLGFACWTSWLLFLVCCAGWIAERLQQRHDKANYLRQVVEDDRDARLSRDKAA